MPSTEAASSLMRRLLPKKMYLRMRKSQLKKRGLKPTVEDLIFIVDDKRIDPLLREMCEAFVSHDVERYLSHFWLGMAQTHIQKLQENGFENFKQTIATEYFTFAQDSNQQQTEFLKRALPQDTVMAVIECPPPNARYPYFTEAQTRYYNLLTTLLWEYAKQQVRPEILDALQEPLVGNPPIIHYDGRIISQDIANSALEYQSITDGLKGRGEISTIMEVGAGYGRLGYVFLKLHPRLHYCIVDIPPALYVSQRYLSEVFPEKKVFRFRDFESYSAVQGELEAADIVFLMPHQLELLPAKLLDLFVAINCLNEMNPIIRQYYFKQVNRLASYMYFKCHKVAHTPHENTVVEQDYPVCPEWERIYWRSCKVQDYFFETLYSVGSHSVRGG